MFVRVYSVLMKPSNKRGYDVRYLLASTIDYDWIDDWQNDLRKPLRELQKKVQDESQALHRESQGNVPPEAMQLYLADQIRAWAEDLMQVSAARLVKSGEPLASVQRTLNLANSSQVHSRWPKFEQTVENVYDENHQGDRLSPESTWRLGDFQIPGAIDEIQKALTDQFGPLPTEDKELKGLKKQQTLRRKIKRSSTPRKSH